MPLELLQITPKPKWLLLAEKEPIFHGYNFVDPGHLLLGLLAFKEGIASRVLTDSGLKLRSLQCDFELLHGFGPVIVVSPPFIKSVKKIFAHLTHTGSAHVLLELISQEEPWTTHTLSRFGIDKEEVAVNLRELMNEPSAVTKERLANEDDLINLDTYWDQGFTWDLLDQETMELKRQIEEQARTAKFRFITPDFMLSMLLKVRDTAAFRLLEKTNVNIDNLHDEFARLLKRPCSPVNEDVFYSHCAMRSFEKAWERAQESEQPYVNSGHLLLSVLQEEGKLISFVKEKLGGKEAELNATHYGSLA